MSRTWLVTGATGFLGRFVVRELLSRTDDALVLASRNVASDAWAAELPKPRVTTVSWDVSQTAPAALGVDITHVLHVAADVRFDRTLDDALRVNCQGTASVLELCQRLPRLELAGFVSTLFTSGLAEGVIPEAPHDGTRGFVNTYEASKFAAERLVFDANAQLPTMVFRMAFGIADSMDGKVVTTNSVHHVLRILRTGVLTTFPGKPQTPLHLTSGEFTASAIVTLALGGPSVGRLFNMAPPPEQVLSLGDMIDLTWERLAKIPWWTPKPKPTWLSPAAYQEATRNASDEARVLASLSTLVQGLYLERTFETPAFSAGLVSAGMSWPSTKALVDAAVADLFRPERPLSRPRKS